MLSLMLKSKLTPIRSKKLSLSVMKRTSMVTWRSCSRRNCSSRSAISSWTSWVWLTTMLRLVSKGEMEPAPPTSSQEVGLTVDLIRSMRLSKSGWTAPPMPPGPPAAARLFGTLGRPGCPAAAQLGQHVGVAGRRVRLAVAGHRHRRGRGRAERHRAAEAHRRPSRCHTRPASPCGRGRSSESDCTRSPT